MFDHYPSSFRTDQAPTEAQLWAQREAKSDTMAADVLEQSLAPWRGDPGVRLRRAVRVTAALAFGAAMAVAIYWLR